MEEKTKKVALENLCDCQIAVITSQPQLRKSNECHTLIFNYIILTSRIHSKEQQLMQHSNFNYIILTS
jgi:hypothetical protein